MGGVINLISRRPPPPGVRGDRELLVNGTTLGGTDAVFWATGRLGSRLGYTLLGGGHRQGRRDRDADGWTDVPGYRRLVLRPRVTWEGEGGHTLFLTGGTTLERREGGTLGGQVAPDGAPFVESLRTERHDLGLMGRFPLSRATLVVVRGSAMTQRHRHRFGETTESDRHGTWFAEATASRALSSSIVIGGVAVQGERYRSDELPRFNYDFTVPGVFVHAEVAEIVGALAERRIGRARFFINLENIGGVRQTQFDPLVRPTRAPDGRWTTDAWGPLEGRVINGGIRLGF